MKRKKIQTGRGPQKCRKGSIAQRMCILFIVYLFSTVFVYRQCQLHIWIIEQNTVFGYHWSRSNPTKSRRAQTNPNPDHKKLHSFKKSTDRIFEGEIHILTVMLRFGNFLAKGTKTDFALL